MHNVPIALILIRLPIPPDAVFASAPLVFSLRQYKKTVHASFTSANSAATSKATTPTDPAAMFISFWVFSANLFFVLEREKRQSGP